MTRSVLHLTLSSGVLAATFLGLAAGHAIAQSPVDNYDFEAYTNANPTTPITVTSGLPSSWLETGAGGHSFIVETFGDFTAIPDLDGNDDADTQTPYAAHLSTFDEGIYQPFPTTPGVDHLIDFVFGQFSEISIPEVRVTVFDGSGLGGSVLTDFTFDADADVYGDGVVTGSYVGGFTASSSTSTIRYLVIGNSGPQNDGVAIDQVVITAVAIPEPGALALTLLGLLSLGANCWRRRRNGRQSYATLQNCPSAFSCSTRGHWLPSVFASRRAPYRMRATLILVSASLAVLTCAVRQTVAASITVDDFDTAQSEVAPPNSASEVNAPTALGGFRDLEVVHNSGSGSVTATASGGELMSSWDSTVTGAVTVQWDGNDNSPAIDVTGLGGFDATDGGMNDEITLRISNYAAPAGGIAMTIQAYEQGNGVPSVFAFNLGNTGFSNVDFIIPFTSFSDPTVFSNLGATEITLDNLSTNGGGDVDLDLIRFESSNPIPEPGTFILALLAMLTLGVTTGRRRSVRCDAYWAPGKDPPRGVN